MKKQIHHDVYIGLVMLFVSLVALIKALPMPENAAQFPELMIVILIAFSLWITYQGIKKTQLINSGKAKKDDTISFEKTKMPLISFVIVVIYTMLIEVLGFFASTTLFVAAFMYFYKIKDLKKIIITLVGLNAFIYFLFVIQLNVPLPKGIIF
jgi:uncharacterized protein with PQ loop repeat